MQSESPKNFAEHSLDDKILAMQAHNLQLKARIVQLNEKLKARDIQFHNLKTSAYWKITTPIRFGIKFLKRIRNLWRERHKKMAQEFPDKTYHFFALQAAHWKTQEKGQNKAIKQVSIWAAQQGNACFYEIAQLLQSAFLECGIEAKIFFISHVKDYIVDKESDLRVIVAPHEFYLFIPEAKVLDLKGAQLWLYNTEQSHTSWYALAKESFQQANLILDLDWDMSQQIRSEGFPAEHLPLLDVPTCKVFDGWDCVETNTATEGLPLSIRNQKCAKNPLEEKLVDRPLDCFFIGSRMERRLSFFAQNAAFFGELQSYLRFEDSSSPIIYGQNSPMNTQTVSRLARRSKILLNIHHSEHTYFEWHRIIMQGIWQGTLVVSEPCTSSFPFIPNQDFVIAPLKEIPEVVEYLIKSKEGQSWAEKIRCHAWQTLHSYPMKDRLKWILDCHARG